MLSVFRFRLRTIFLLAIALSAVLRTVGAFAADSRPNFVFVLTDDQRWDSLGVMGNAIVQTPHLDALAADGVLFTNMFCTTSICATSRASFLTGQYERRHGIDGFRTPLTAEQFADSFAGRLKTNGYHTGMVGKWGLGGELPKDSYCDFRGYSGQGRYFPKGKEGQPGEHQTHKLGADAIDFLADRTADEPFLLQFYTKAAHCQDGDPWPFQPDPRYNDLFTDTTIPAPPTATAAHFEALPEFLQNSEARRRWHVRFANAELYQKSVKDYYRLIAGVDDVVGNIVEALKQHGLYDNTVIIFSSDNGFYLGEHGLAGKWFMHEESIRLPLVIHDPRLPESRRGQTVSEIALNIDIAPTILDMAGIEIPESMQGRSLVPLIEGRPVDWREDFLYEHRFEHPRIPQTEGVRTNRYTYTRYTSIDPVYEELFDLEEDRYQTTNLASDPRYADTLEKLRSRWQELAERASHKK